MNFVKADVACSEDRDFLLCEENKPCFSHHALGMKEPMASRGYSVSHLDLLVMPLVACDHHGTRMGMGGGFYDRTLATAPHQPFRLGLAHTFQLLDQTLPRQAWDQPLDALLTPHGIYRFKR